MKPQEITRDPRDAVIGLDAGEAVRAAAYGRRAAKLARLTALGLPVPPGVALSFDCGRRPGRRRADARAAAADRPRPARSPCAPAPSSAPGAARRAILNIGVSDRTVALLGPRIGVPAALRLFARCVSSFAHAVHGIDPEDFEALGRRHFRGATDPDEGALRGLLADVLALYEAETGEPWPAGSGRTSSKPPPAPWRGPGTPPPPASCARPRARRTGRPRPRRAGHGARRSAAAPAARATCSWSAAAPARRTASASTCRRCRAPAPASAPHEARPLTRRRAWSPAPTRPRSRRSAPRPWRRCRAAAAATRPRPRRRLSA